MNIVQWIKESCDRQEAQTPEDYIGMTLAYARLRRRWDNEIAKRDQLHIPYNFNVLDVMVLSLAELVNNEPEMTFHTEVSFSDGGFTKAVEFVHRQIDFLLATTNEGHMTEGTFYKRFKEIQPFAKGNELVGALLYNWYNNTLEDPVHPPEFEK